MKIIGAGLSGLLCGALNPGSTIYERQPQLPNNHGAILRFRSDKISKALGIPFKQVLVTKAIWYGLQEREPTPRIQNLYSSKVTGKYISRSINNINPVTRYIAPDNFTEMLAERCNIEYNIEINDYHQELFSVPYVSTIPLPMMIEIVDLLKGRVDKPEFHRRKIWTNVYDVDDADIYQTIYFPDKNTPIYRASFTGNKLFCEFISDPEISKWRIEDTLKSFGIDEKTFYTHCGFKEQQYGKIVDIDPVIRRSIMAKLTHEYNVYSLGRFATWRNILLDDVYDDIYRIRELMNLDNYSRRIKLAEERSND